MVPEPVRHKAISLGVEGLKWLNSLGQLIRQMEKQWQLVVIGECLEGGSEAYVTRAKTADGLEVVLKLGMPEMSGNSDLKSEIQALSLADGHGYARLLKYDIERRALLLERLGAPLRDLPLSTSEQIRIICSTLQQSWTPVPQEVAFQSGANLAMGLADFIERLSQELGSPSSEKALKMVLSFTQSRAAAHQPECAVLVHGDAHNGNLLQSLDDASLEKPLFKFIDPDGIQGEPACDLGVLMRAWPDDLLSGDPAQLGRDRCDYISSLTGVRPRAIWEWGLIQCMSTGLFLMQVGNAHLGSQLLKIADACAEGAGC